MLEVKGHDRPATISPDLVVEGGRTSAAATAVQVPGDKSVSHRALLAALLPGAPRRLTIRNANLGGAVRALLPALRALGLDTLVEGDVLTVRRAAPVPQEVRPHHGIPHWPDGITQGPDGIPYLETAGSSAAARLLIGVLAGIGRGAVVDGDEVLRHRPMDWIVTPLNELGAEIRYLGHPGRLPVLVGGRVHRSRRVELAVGSAQARSAVLLGAVAAGVPAELCHPVRSRDHTERMLAAFGARLTEGPGVVGYDGGPCSVPSDIEVPGDPSLAAYPVAAHLLRGDGGELRIPGVCLNPTRTGFFDVLRRAGAAIDYQDLRTTAGGEPVGTVVTRAGLDGVRAVTADDPGTLHALIDEVPLLAAVATRLPGTSRIRCAGELRFKETDRLITTARMATAFGARVTVEPDGLTVHGRGADGPTVNGPTGDGLWAGGPRVSGPREGGPREGGSAVLSARTVPGFEDHRIAMAAATLATALPGRTTITGGACHTTSFPGFTDVLRAVGAAIHEVTL
ncbi:3-phosphoshikimate 1-carboxyvinyltransferase [Streptomyces tauricus]|uniref:3-phosphoshikimate 1-carboxyvinyltransferase n=1 Tax=Streptomyces tauricus TaxID=68274 RepID=UPI00199B6A5F|nr:3-phosphoshikimate 1-carboxyvinyltransferase [Streptomyces tauricus]GHA26957.1 3-phosphoshikimate 1-carboxyvinyltransferase [Streptomyces tauricus]